MKIKALRELLARDAASSPATREFDLLLGKIDDAEVAEFVKAIRAPIGKIEAALAKRRDAAKETAIIISRFIAELESAKDDNAAFQATVDRIKAMKALKADEANAIANAFLGGQQIFKSKSDAAKALLKRQITDKRSGERKSAVSGIF